MHSTKAVIAHVVIALCVGAAFAWTLKPQTPASPMLVVSDDLPVPRSGFADTTGNRRVIVRVEGNGTLYVSDSMLRNWPHGDLLSAANAHPNMVSLALRQEIEPGVRYERAVLWVGTAAIKGGANTGELVAAIEELAAELTRYAETVTVLTPWPALPEFEDQARTVAFELDRFRLNGVKVVPTADVWRRLYDSGDLPGLTMHGDMTHFLRSAQDRLAEAIPALLAAQPG